jgi:hypothetical protein
MDSSRIASFSQGFALVILAACAGCSSSSGTPMATSGSNSGSGSGSGTTSGSSSGSASSGSGGTPGCPGSTATAAPTAAVAGTGTACPAVTTQTVGVMINMNVTWPATASIKGGKGPYTLWLLSTYDVTGLKIAATIKTCQLTTPPIFLTPTGDIASGLMAGAGGKVGTASPVSEWDKVKRTSMTTGTLGGWNIGSSLAIADSVTLDGLPETGSFKDPTTKWPPASAAGNPFGMGFMYVNENTGETSPGITVIPLATTGYAQIRTGLGGMQPATDALYIASRTELSMYGTSTSCTETSGTATVKLIDNHVIGCNIENDGGTCGDTQYGYIDSNRTVYVPGAAAFIQKVLKDGATCDDVIAALPAPTCP